MTVSDIIEKRKLRWKERGDLTYDQQLARAGVIKILKTPSLRQEIIEKPYLLIEVAFCIVDKKKKTVPFFFNEVQSDFIRQYEQHGNGRPYYILKGRQQGFTSLLTAMQLSFAVVRRNFSGFTLADKADNSLAIFNDKARMVYERLPDELKPAERFSSKKELFFDKLNSSWRVAVASDQVGRSRTLNFVHFSEVAFYACSLADLQKGIGEAMTADCFCVYETTAHGFNEAKDLWDSGSCINLFYEWWRTSEYRSTDYRCMDEASDPWLLERIQLLQEKGLDREQIAWYCKKYDSYLDKNTIKQEYPCTPEEAFISSGNSIFDIERLNNRMLQVADLKPRCGFFTYQKEGIPILDSRGNPVDMEWRLTDIRFEERKDGYIWLHEEPLVKRDRGGNAVSQAPYVLGGDTAGSGDDYFTGKLICNLDGRTVATLRRQHIDEDLYAEQMLCLGWYYNHALIGIETNYSRHPTRVLQQKYNYPHLYMRERLDRMHDERELVYGFETTPKTKPIIINELVMKMRESPDMETDLETLREMTTFVKKENGSMEALDGYHDDLVMALAIAHFISTQQEHGWMEAEPEEDRFLEENFHTESDSGGNGSYMNWEDY